MRRRSPRTGAATTVLGLAQAALGSSVDVGIHCWDGTRAGDPEAPLQLNLRRPRALRRLLWSPDELGFARAYVSGDLDIDGDIYSGLAQLNRVTDPTEDSTAPGGRIGRLSLLRDAVRLGALGPPPRPPEVEIRLGGLTHSQARDAAAVRHHYDVGNDFYRLVLGPSLTYSCAYWDEVGAASYDLEGAQLAKCRLVADKLEITQGTRVLDVGCGWGTFAIVAAQEYGAEVVGVTLSPEQARLARKRVAEAGLTDRIDIRIQDYRDIDDGPFDAIASIGMAEHVGRSRLSTYVQHLYGLLRPEGRLLNHAISIRPGREDEPSANSFIDRYVFPDGELLPLQTIVGAIEDGGFEVRDVHGLREHYALTLRAWVANLDRNWDAAVTAASEQRARVWRLYMVGSALTFEAGGIGVNQVLGVRAAADGMSGFPLRR